jgi:predicted amidohydrolase YtcJ
VTSGGPSATASGADLVLHRGRILTSAADREVVDAIAVRDGHVVAAGPDAEVLPLRRGKTVSVDLGGRTAIPGLIDSHMHAVRAGLTWSLEVRWDDVPTLVQALQLITSEAERRPHGSWICVLGGWHPGQFREGRPPDQLDLDRAAPDHPVFVQRLYDGAILNARGLQAAGITADRPDPAGGQVERDAEGHPTGLVTGMGALQHCLQAIGEPDRRGQAEATVSFLRHLAGWGLTGVVDAGGFGMTPDRYGPLFDAWEGRNLPVRMRLFVGAATPGNEEEEVRAWLEHMRGFPGDDLLDTVGIGELAVFGCHDTEGLAAREFSAADVRRLEQLSRLVAAENRPMQLHAILDSSVRAILDVWERVDREHRLCDRRFSLAHVELASAESLQRAHDLGLGIAIQNRLSLRAADTAEAWGDPALHRAPPLRSIVDLGMPFGAGTDSTRVASPNPWSAIQWLTTGEPFDGGPRRHETERLTVHEAIESYTAGSAWFSGEEHDRGRLRPGYRADVAVLTDDCLTVPPHDLHAIRSVLTLVGGRRVHADAGFADVP